MNDNIIGESLEVLKDYDKLEPIVVRRENRLSNIPNFYGEEFHGVLRRSKAEEMLQRTGEGAYLIRLSTTSESCILSFIFNGKIFHYETNFFDGSYLINGKRFSNVTKMVKNGFEEIIEKKHEMNSEKENETEKLSHSFKSYQFKTPKNCKFCQNKIWGPFQKRLKCCNCGFSFHQNCSSKFVHDCLPNLKYVKRIFGVDLIVVCLAQNGKIPKIIEKCIEEIEKRGLKEEGIYRLSGSEAEIEALKNKFDSGSSEIDFTVAKNIHSICNLLNLYLRSLPTPLIPCKTLEIIFEQFQMNQQKTNEHKIEVLRNEILKLDIFRQKTLACLFRHFKNVVQFSAQNKMNANNLALIFVPSLFRLLSVMDYICKPAYFKIIEFLIKMPDIILRCD